MQNLDEKQLKLKLYLQPFLINSLPKLDDKCSVVVVSRLQPKKVQLSQAGGEFAKAGHQAPRNHRTEKIPPTPFESIAVRLA